MFVSFLFVIVKAPQNIEALLNLLDDPDDQVFDVVRNEILDFGTEIIDDLETQWENAEDVLKMQRIEQLIYTIKSTNAKNQLEDWIKGGAKNLLTGALAVARYQFHNLNEQKVFESIEKIKQDIWIEINDYQTALEKIKVFNHIFYNVHGFKGNAENFHAPQNSFINRVIESKKGTPLSLGILYIVIAESLEIPVYGVNLPHHFVLAYKDKHPLRDFFPFEDEILFYINPFALGASFGRPELQEFVEQLNVPFEEHYFNPCDNKSIIKRMINNLVYSYDKAGRSDKAYHFKQLLEVFK